jgi:hypothetical protein
MKKHSKSIVTLFRLPWGAYSPSSLREEWFQGREEGMSYRSTLKGEKAAEEAFHLTNAPEECLTKKQIAFLKEQNFKGPSLSVGDVVRVTDIIDYSKSDYFVCKSFSWEKFKGNKIELLKHLR